MTARLRRAAATAPAPAWEHISYHKRWWSLHSPVWCMQIVARWFCDICSDLVPPASFEYKSKPPGVMQYQDGKKLFCWLNRKREKSSGEVLWIMHGAWGGERTPVWALNGEYLTSEWTGADCRSLLWQTCPSLHRAGRPRQRASHLHFN